MKTQVLNLESYDDRHSIIDKLNWGQADRVIMLFPMRDLALTNKLDLKLIHRQCQASGTKLALVTKNRQIKDFAHELNIPVFRSLRQAQKIAWEYMVAPDKPVNRPENRHSRQELAEMVQASQPSTWTTNKVVRTIAFVFSLLSVLVLAAYLIPSATIEYLPQLETQSLEITLTGNPGISSFNLSGAIPARPLVISVEGRSSITPSGQLSIPAQNASGLVQFTNLTNDAVIVPAGTIIRTADPASSIRFRTSTETTLEPEAGSKINVPIEAENPGSTSNLPADTLVQIEDDLSRFLTVTNLEPTGGGTDTNTTAPTPEDYDQLSDELLESLWSTALEEARSSLHPKDIILYDQPQTITIVEETFSPPEPQPSSTLDLILRVDYEILTIQWEDLKNMGNAILDATLPNGYSAQNETFDIKSISDPMRTEEGQVTWTVILTRQTFTTSKENQAVEDIRGQSAQSAAASFEKSLSLSQSPQVTIFPDWWPLLPFAKFRIQTVDILQVEP